MNGDNIISLAKFSGADLDTSREFTHDNIWELQENDNWSRLIIGAKSQEIPLMLDLAKGSAGPFGILYVLVTPRRNHKGARYQSPFPVDFAALESFLYKFQDFFEQDGRHHLWVISLEDGEQFIFDNHNVVFAYGNTQRFISHLEGSDFTESRIVHSSPHTHHFHPEFDRSEDAVMQYWDWKEFPLQPPDNA